MTDLKPTDAIEQLTNRQQQADMDGTFVTVSRQALDEVLAYVARQPVQPSEPMLTPEEEAELVERINGSYYLQPNPTPTASTGEELVEELARAICTEDGIQDWDALPGSYKGRVLLDEYMRSARAILPIQAQREAAAHARGKAEERAKNGRDTELLDNIQSESWDLRCFADETGGGDADIMWQVLGHYQAIPQERVIAEVWEDDPRKALEAAIEATGQHQPAQREGQKP